MFLENLTILVHENTNLVQLPLTDSVLVSDKGDMACNLSLHVHNAHVLQYAEPHEGFPRSQVEQRSNSEIPSGGADQPLSERRERSRPAAASPPPDAGSLAVRAASRGPLPPFGPAHVSFRHRTLKSNDRLPGLILPSKSSEPLCREAMIPIERTFYRKASGPCCGTKHRAIRTTTQVCRTTGCGKVLRTNTRLFVQPASVGTTAILSVGKTERTWGCTRSTALIRHVSCSLHAGRKRAGLNQLHSKD